MIRILGFLLAVAAIAAVAVWISEPPGRVEITWGDYLVEMAPGVLAGMVAIAAAAVLLVVFIVRFFVIGPGRIARSQRLRRERLGYRSLTQGLVAAAAGDARGARRLARRANALLDEPPLTLLLSAQAAQLEGDDEAAHAYFEAMLERPETEFLGLRGLLVQADRAGDPAMALQLAERAFALRPETPWVLTALLELQTRAGRWSDALITIKQARRYGAIDDAAGKRRQKGLLCERARALREQGDVKEAFRTADQARDIDAGFVPAALLAGVLARDAGRASTAARIVIQAWARCPHPELGRLFVTLFPDMPPLERLKRVEKLASANATDPESHMLLAREALEAKLWGNARQHLEKAAAERPTGSLYRLMARVEELEHQDAEAVRRRLEQASVAPPDPTWLCDRCANAAPTWSIACPSCGALDSIDWRAPKHAEVDALAASTETPLRETAATPQAEPVPAHA
jgi:HemY protein